MERSPGGQRRPRVGRSSRPLVSARPVADRLFRLLDPSMDPYHVDIKHDATAQDLSQVLPVVFSYYYVNTLEHVHILLDAASDSAERTTLPRTLEDASNSD